MYWEISMKNKNDESKQTGSTINSATRPVRRGCRDFWENDIEVRVQVSLLKGG
jgi:hypothetical protein